MDTESAIDNPDIPQWKKDLIARLRSQNRSLAGEHDQQHQQHGQYNHHTHRQRPAAFPPPPPLPSSSPSTSSSSSVVVVGGEATGRSNNDDVVRESATCSPVKKFKMVQERSWTDTVNENAYNGYRRKENSDSDSSEDLHYGPGIVKKLKNKYLSLALRESNSRPSILHMRKATSLEDLLDDDDVDGGGGGQVKENRLFETKLNGTKTIPNRYHRKQARGEMKRARSVEAISRVDNGTTATPNRQSLHEDMLITAKQEGNDHAVRISRKTQDKPETNPVHYNHRTNRPKRLQPMMNEKEKPPADFVRQAKMIFERRPEQRTKKPPPTGEVAAKVDSFNNIIVKAKVEAKVTKKPPVKSAKPVFNDNKGKPRPVAKPVVVREEIAKSPPLKPLDFNKIPKKDVLKDLASLPSPIPDVSRIDFHIKGENDNNLSETPDLILTSSPLSSTSPVHKKVTSENFLKEEIRNTSPVLESPSRKITSPLLSPNRIKPASPLLSPSYNRPVSPRLQSPVRPATSPLSPVKRSTSPHSPVRRSASPLSPVKISSSPLSPVKISASPLSPVKRSASPLSPVKRSASPLSPVKPAPSPLFSPVITSPKPAGGGQEEPDSPGGGYKVVSTTSVSNISKQSTSAVFNFTDKKVNKSHLPVNKNTSDVRVPPSQPLQIDVSVANGPLLQQRQPKEKARSPPRFSPPPPPPQPQQQQQQPQPQLQKVEKKTLTTTEIEKNLINATRSEQPKTVCVNVSVEVVNATIVPKILKPREQSSNIAVFNFTNRKEVPDYISNDKSRTPSKPELPKPGEGGIIVLSAASLESFIDEEEEILRSLEGPPSPCDVTFINDNILIDGKSSLSQKTKRTKLKISFVEEGPEVYEYPSETSLLLDDDSLILSPHVGHTVPNLGGSYLANYTPKTTESFQPGVTRSIQPNIPAKQDVENTEITSDLLLQEADKPFSLGANADILF